MEDYRKLAAKLRICHNPDVDCDGCEDEQVEGCIHKNIGLAADAIENLLTENAALRQQEHFRDLTKKVEPMTNAQKIRAMSYEELAEFLIDLADDGNLRIRGWLQQPAEEDEAK